MDLSEVLMSRAGSVAARLAQRFGAVCVGDRMPRMQDLADELSCGKGTIQAAFDLLSGAGALVLRSRGRLGSFVEDINYAVLWQLAGERSVSVSLPLPYTRRYEGLATGVHAAFAAIGIPLTLMFLRGSIARAQALHEGRTDFAIMSALAAGIDSELEVVHGYGAGSYVEAHGVILADGRDMADPNLRVSVDPSSADQICLVEHVFGPLSADRRIELSYNQLDAAFRSGVIDATVWNVDEIHSHITGEVEVRSVDLSAMASNTHAVVVRTRTAQPVAAGVLTALTDRIVMERAADVISGRTIPTY